MYTHYFRYFEEIARERSFTKAAKNLHISQQSLSEYIKRLEERYGIQLFRRKPKLHLTHAGELLLEYISRSLYHEERLLAEFSHIRSQQKGRIRVGVTPTRAPIFFPLIYSRFNELHPLVELSLREDHTTNLIKDLMDGKIDFIIGLDDTSTSQNRILTSTTLLQDRKLYFLASRKLLFQYEFPEQRMEAALAEGVRLDEIQNIPIILNPGKSQIHSQIMQEYIKLRAKPNIAVESSNVLSLLPLCSAGNAGMFMSQTILRHTAAHYSGALNNVLAFPVQNILINCDIALIHFCDKPISVHFNDFIEITKNIFAEYHSLISR
ncbi:MAG: LysR family transcriptional regulator [Defluviitaleaceae bacterium]|nr:LysR family transcriptional regulator [Defluviitaleaceae bacterium]